MATWDTFTNQRQWEQYLKHLVKTNEKALRKAIVLIYNNQTYEEQTAGKSTEDNYVGFTKWDAEQMSLIARKILRGEKLSEGEIAKSQNKIQKYWKQLMWISKEKIKQRELERSQKEVEEQQIYESEQEILRQYDEAITRCKEQGIPCNYGICSECVLNDGIQMRMGEL